MTDLPVARHNYLGNIVQQGARPLCPATQTFPWMFLGQGHIEELSGNSLREGEDLQPNFGP